jgi:hypothetical protein
VKQVLVLQHHTNQPRVRGPGDGLRRGTRSGAVADRYRCGSEGYHIGTCWQVRATPSLLGTLSLGLRRIESALALALTGRTVWSESPDHLDSVSAEHKCSL